MNNEWNYIPVDEDLIEKPRFIRFREAAGLDDRSACGLLFQVWRWVKKMSPEGVLPPDEDVLLCLKMTKTELKALQQHMCHPETRVMCGWEDGAGKGTAQKRKKRELDAERKRRQREAKAAEKSEDLGPADPKPSRDEKPAAKKPEKKAPPTFDDLLAQEHPDGGTALDFFKRTYVVFDGRSMRPTLDAKLGEIRDYFERQTGRKRWTTYRGIDSWLAKDAKAFKWHYEKENGKIEPSNVNDLFEAHGFEVAR